MINNFKKNEDDFIEIVILSGEKTAKGGLKSFQYEYIEEPSKCTEDIGESPMSISNGFRGEAIFFSGTCILNCLEIVNVFMIRYNFS